MGGRVGEGKRTEGYTNMYLDNRIIEIVLKFTVYIKILH